MFSLTRTVLRSTRVAVYNISSGFLNNGLIIFSLGFCNVKLCQHGVGQRFWDPPLWGGPNLPDLFPVTAGAALVYNRGVPGVGLQIGTTYRFTLRTTIYGTQLWSWSRVTELNHGAPSVTFLCRTRYSMAGTYKGTFASGEINGSGGVCRKRRRWKR